MLELSDLAIIEKNKTHSDGALLFLLEIIMNDESICKLVRNNENITWNNEEWIAFPFDLGDVNENSKGELPTLDIVVQDTTRTVQGYVEMYNGGKNARAILRVVHSKFLELTIPELEESFAVITTKYDAKGVTFSLGSDFPLTKRIPRRRYMKDFCSFKYKGVECACTSNLTDCNHTLEDCRARNNSVRFGGCPGLARGGYYA